MLSGPDPGPAPTAFGKGRFEGARAAAAPYIARGAALPARSNACRSRAGCPPARGGGAAASQHLPPRVRRGGPACPAPRTALPPSPLFAGDGRSRGSAPASAAGSGWGSGPTGMGRCRLPAEPALRGNLALPGLLFFLLVLFVNFQCAPPRIAPRDPRGAGKEGRAGRCARVLGLPPALALQLQESFARDRRCESALCRVRAILSSAKCLL